MPVNSWPMSCTLHVAILYRYMICADVGQYDDVLEVLGIYLHIITLWSTCHRYNYMVQ